MTNVIPKESRELIHGVLVMTAEILKVTEDGLQPGQDAAAILRKLVTEGTFRDALYNAVMGAQKIPEEIRTLSVGVILEKAIEATKPE